MKSRIFMLTALTKQLFFIHGWRPIVYQRYKSRCYKASLLRQQCPTFFYDPPFKITYRIFPFPRVNGLHIVNAITPLDLYFCKCLGIFRAVLPKWIRANPLFSHEDTTSTTRKKGLMGLRALINELACNENLIEYCKELLGRFICL